MVSVLGFFLIWATRSYAGTFSLICNKSTITTKNEFSLDKVLGEITGQFIEIGFAALGADLIGLAFDIKIKDDLDLKTKNALGGREKLNERELQWKQEFNHIKKYLDSSQP